MSGPVSRTLLVLLWCPFLQTSSGESAAPLVSAGVFHLFVHVYTGSDRVRDALNSAPFLPPPGRVVPKLRGVIPSPVPALIS